MNPAEQALRHVDRYQQQHPWVGVPFAVVKKFGDDKGGNLTTLLAYNGFFALLPLLLVLITLLGYLLGHHPTMEQQVLHSALAEFPILGTQLEQNVHALRANGIGLAVGIAGSLWGARGVTQAGQHAMAELWNIPGKNRPSFWTRQARGLALPLVFAVGLAATTLLTGLGSLGSHTAPFRLANLVLATGVNIALYLLAFGSSPPARSPPASWWSAPLWAGSPGRRWWLPVAIWSATTSSMPARCTASSLLSWACCPGCTWGHSSPCTRPRSTSSVPGACGHAACSSHRSPNPTSAPWSTWPSRRSAGPSNRSR